MNPLHVKDKKLSSLRFRIVFFFVYGLVLLMVAEASARLVWSFRHVLIDRLGLSEVNLDNYEFLDQQSHRIVRLRAGFQATLAQAVAAKEARRKLLGAESLRNAASRFGLGNDTVIFSINEAGYKGSPIDRTHSSLRILALGDSTIFGSLIDKYSYPRVVETELEEFGLRSEVINGGVEGYTPVI